MRRIYVKTFYPNQSFLPGISMDMVIEAVSEVSEIPESHIRDLGRKRPNADARMVACAVMYELIPSTSWPSIARYFGYKSHSSVYHAIEQTKSERSLIRLKKKVITELTGR